MKRHLVLLLVLTLCLGCAGLFGYGDELAAAEARPGTPFQLAWTTGDDVTLDLWLDYGVSYDGDDYEVTGTLMWIPDHGTPTTWPLQLSAAGSPIQGAGRRSMYKRHVEGPSGGRLSETVRLVGLPRLEPGERAQLMGTVQAGTGTTLKHARFVVTE